VKNLPGNGRVFHFFEVSSKKYFINVFFLLPREAGCNLFSSSFFPQKRSNASASPPSTAGAQQPSRSRPSGREALSFSFFPEKRNKNLVAQKTHYVNCHFLLAQKVTKKSLVREKTRFSILQEHIIRFACSLICVSQPISYRLIFTNSVSSLPEIAFVQLRQFSLTVYFQRRKTCTIERALSKNLALACALASFRATKFFFRR
jgi:hypothetical protein